MQHHTTMQHLVTPATCQRPSKARRWCRHSLLTLEQVCCVGANPFSDAAFLTQGDLMSGTGAGGRRRFLHGCGSSAASTHSIKMTPYAHARLHRYRHPPCQLLGPVTHSIWAVGVIALILCSGVHGGQLDFAGMRAVAVHTTVHSRGCLAPACQASGYSSFGA